MNMLPPDGGPSSLTGYADVGGPENYSERQPYEKVRENASFLVCKIPYMDEIMYSVDAKSQLTWLHRLHQAIDDIMHQRCYLDLTETRPQFQPKWLIWKVDVAGDLLQFAAGTEIRPCPARGMCTFNGKCGANVQCPAKHKCTADWKCPARRNCPYSPDSNGFNSRHGCPYWNVCPQKHKCPGNDHCLAGDSCPAKGRCPSKTLVRFARELMELSQDPWLRLPGNRPFRMAMGMDSGTIGAGIIGLYCWKYGFFGGPVTFANRLCQLSASGFLRISEDTYSALVRSDPEEHGPWWEVGGPAPMLDGCMRATYLLRDSTVLHDVTLEEIRAAYGAVNEAWSESGPSMSALRDPTTETLYSRFLARRTSPAPDIRCMKIILMSCGFCVAVFVAMWMLGMPGQATPLAITHVWSTRRSNGGLPPVPMALLVLLCIPCVCGVFEGQRNPTYYINHYRTWIIVAIRTLLTTRHLAAIFAYAPIATIQIGTAFFNWANIAENARGWQAFCANPEISSPVGQSVVAFVPASMRGGFADMVAGVFPSIAMVVEHGALVMQEVTMFIVHQAEVVFGFFAFFDGSLSSSQVADSKNLWLMGARALVTCVWLALPLAVASTAMPLRLKVNLWSPLGWLPLVSAAVSEYIIGFSATSPCQVAVTGVVGWLIPTWLQYTRHEKPLLDTFFYSIM